MPVTSISWNIHTNLGFAEVLQPSHFQVRIPYEMDRQMDGQDA